MVKKLVASILISITVGGIIGGVGTYYLHNNKPKLNDTTLLAYNWLENSGEASALEYQAYKTATDRVEQLAKVKTDKPKAVIMGIDETVVNNGDYLGWQIKNNKGYSKADYTEWINQNKATAVDGAAAFTQKCKELGIEVFYVSNRFEKEDLKGTIANMDKLGLAYADAEHILLVTDKSSKQARWDKVKAGHDVIMQVGDSLTDFSTQFEKKTVAQEKEEVKANANKFGTEYIIIPNPVYGNFESAIYNNDLKKTDDQKLADRWAGVQSTTITAK